MSTMIWVKHSSRRIAPTDLCSDRENCTFFAISLESVLKTQIFSCVKGCSSPNCQQHRLDLITFYGFVRSTFIPPTKRALHVAPQPEPAAAEKDSFASLSFVGSQL